MDEDDSQDELINRSSSHSKGNRAALWAISDESDNVEEESEEGESDSGEEEEEDHLDGEDDEDDEEEEEDEEEDEEGDAKAEDGAFGGTSLDLTGMSSDEDTEKCPICLNSFSSQPVATPENCQHYFCLDCILAWAKNANSCPVDRIAFNSIYLRKCYGGKVKKMITVQKPVKEGQEETVDLDLEQTSCEVCGGSDREDRLLLCDGCDAGYHMECLTPPLDSVPVEEWFCPECQANNRHLRGSAEDISDTESLPSTARAATSRSQSTAVGPTRAIARTQQSERVRANVNRHRITQARSSELAPTYLIQSTWLDETINAVVSGLNTAVYIRDFTPRVPSGRRRNTGKRRKVRRKKTSSKGKAASTGVRRRKRKVRRTKSRKKLMLKKPATPRSRLANNLRITKDKKGSSLPTVYRPSEHTLSSMRADIGAASLSIYGDPFDLDPFVDREEEEQQAHVTSLLEAKRRGISHSALRSHQPVARPVTASLSRRSVEAPQLTAVVEAAPVPDLLGSILSGQSVLLMDSSNVVINRDGSLKATKQMMPSVLDPGCSNNSSSVDTSTQISPGMSPMQGDCSPSLHYNGDLPESSHSSMNRPFSQSSSRLPPHITSSANHVQPSSHSDFPPRSHPGLQPPIRPMHPPSHWRTGDSSSKGNEVASSQPKKGPPKPMWVDVSVLPRIPKIKRESNGIIQGGSNRNSSNSRNTNNSTSSSNSYGMPGTGVNSLAGDKVRQQSIDQQKGRADGQAQRPDRASSSSAFSNSFASSSSTGSSTSQPHYSSSSSSSSTSSSVSFRINSSGQSWQSKRLSSSSSSPAGGSTQAPRREWEEDAKKKQLCRDKQMLLASRTLANKQQSSDNIYDPFDPTLSDSSSSGDEAESTSMVCRSRLTTCEGKTPSLIQRKHDRGPVKTETQEIEKSQEEPRRTSAQDATLQELQFLEEYVKVEKEFRLIDSRNKTEKQTLLTTKVKKETGLDDAEEAESFGHSIKKLKPDLTPPVQHSLELLKTEGETPGEESGQRVGTTISAPPVCKNDSSASSSAPTKKKQKLETKSDSKSSPKLRDLGNQKKTLTSSSSETDRGRIGEHHTSGSQRRSRSRERRRARSPSGSSRSSSPEMTHGKSQRSPSKDRRRSRSGSSSSSKDHSRRKKNKLWSKERKDGRERVCERRVSRDKRNAHSRSKSRSRSRSRSLERRKDHSRPQRSSLSSRDKVESKDKRKCRSRSSSREKRKEEASSSKSSQKTSSSKYTKQLQGKKKEKDITQSFVKEEKDDTVNKQTASSSTAVSEVLKKGRDQVKEMKGGKEIKKEKQLSLDMFEDSSSLTKPIKKEETLSDTLMLTKSINEEGNKPIKAEPFEMKTLPVKIKTEPVKIKTESVKTKTEPVKIKTEPVKIKTESVKTKTEPVKSKTEPVKIKTESVEIKTETFEIPILKSEPNYLKLCPTPPVTSCSTLATPPTADKLQDTVSQSQAEVMASREPADTAGFTVPVKQEGQQPSDSDDDFNVDMMLDSLDYLKSEGTEESTTTIKQEKEVEEENNVQVSVAGTKSKMQVKRVTWNIQEPEGPQPEKSASKLSLYKLKLKQEGARRPSAVQTSRDTSGSVSHPSKMGAVGPLSNSSRSDGVHGEAEEGDLSRKDQYLKKLHMQERAIEEVKLAIKPFYQRRDINKDEYKEILRKAVQKVCHSKSGEINPVKVGNLVKAYVDKYKHSRKHKKGQVSGQAQKNLS